ncbi:MAG: amidohydrolase family protein [Candidatus Marinimicrobia bacterium]|jgi:cytosine/adenosine deaminase-related metal-dependent hydrolase|nr:amidohydrolase family protein [Candidatus Neomarinimicrobiota bacterium]MDD5230578.1 amidohydrolase family protein [Candidatus Neomarinimicrobiota bacterium]
MLNNPAENPELLNGYTARWVVPVSKPPIEQGVVIVRGQQIVEVESADKLQSVIDTPLIDLGNSVIFPGFINTHTHLEHPPLNATPNSYINYIKCLHDFSQIDESLKAEYAAANLQDTYNFGTIALADFTTRGASYNTLLESQLFARLFFEVNGFKNYEAAQIIRTFRELVRDQAPDKRITKHLAPSSVWSTSPQLLREINFSERHIAIHMDILPDENEFTLNGGGLIRQILHASDSFDYSWEVPGLTAIRYFFSNHFYARHNILIHMNCATPDEIDFLKEFGVKVNICLCPRSNRILSENKAPVEMFLEKGVNLCLGTESRALVPDLDIRKEMVDCVDLYGISPENALKFATLNGAYAIGFHKEVGSLESAKTARCLVVDASDMSDSNPYEMILGATQTPHWLI